MAVRAGVILPVHRTDGHARTADARLAEAVELASAIHLDVVHSAVVSLKSRRPATYIGPGRVSELAETIGELDIAVVVLDAPLSPIQQRNLENAWGCKVIDRTALILEIFGERARTREGRLQVELAALTYQRSRLVRSWTHLERQRGGYGFLGGPGESQIEADRRQIAERITRIKRELEQVKRTRGLHREARARVPFPLVALVGYTNAGKSTLFNRLTGSDILVGDQLFATLDPTMRGVTLGSGRRIILSDTVGFISDLPTELVAAFRATLEEVMEADLLIHVRDISHPDSDVQCADVLDVLRDLGLEERLDQAPVEALNKIDRLDGEARLRLRSRAGRNPDQEPVSATSGEGCDALLRLVDQRLSRARRVEDIGLGTENGAAIAWLYEHGEVIERFDDGENAFLRVALDAKESARFEHLYGDKKQPVPEGRAALRPAG